MALMVAGFVDFLQIAVFPLFFEGGFSPFDDVLDVMAAISLMAICGFKWQFVVAFFMELVPFLDILPTWTAVALLLPASDGPVEDSPRAASDDRRRRQIPRKSKSWTRKSWRRAGGN